MVNIRNIDLNLLVILEALLEEAHVGRAATRLGMTQPAASNALARARALFDDPLLVRGPARGLRRTPRADALREPLRSALSDLSDLVSSGPPDLDNLKGVVRLVVSDIPAATIGAELAAQMALKAPGIDLIFHPWHVGDEVNRLERGEVDIVISVKSTSGVSLKSEWLGTSPYMVVMRRDHPLSAVETLDLDQWLAFPHIIVSGSGSKHGPVDGALARVGRDRRVATVVPTFLQALELISQTDFVATFPAAVMASKLAGFLTSRVPPVSLQPVTLHLVWHHRSEKDPAVSVVNQLLRGIAPQVLVVG